MTDFSCGQQLCHCTLLLRCGAGAYGEVWLVRDEVGAPAALKIVPNGGRYSEREIAGLRNYRKCDHPNLLRIRHIEITPEFLFYTMDAADDLNHGKGGYLPDTLANRLRRMKRLDGVEISRMLDGLLEGLSELHRHDLVHRDIKPDNILWVNGRPTLADAGLIAPAGAGSLVGTPGFLSPRLLAGQGSAEPEDDYYALGKVIYCALTGNPVERYPSIPRDLTLSGNADWNRLFQKLCESPASSAGAFRKKMQAPPPPCRRRRIWFGVALGGVVFTGFLFFFFLFRPSRQKTVTLPTNEMAVPHDPPLSLAENVSFPVVWADTASPVLFALHEAGLYDHERLEALLDLPCLSQNDFFARLEKCGNSPRMSGFPRYFADKTASPLEKELMTICRDYGEIPPGDLRERQFYWQCCQGGKLEIQRKMLAEDPVMQAAALDLLLFEKIDSILDSGKLDEVDKALLTRWIRLKNSFFH